MCQSGQPAVPSSAAEAVAMAQAGLAWLATADAGSLPASVQADCLRGLERAGSMHTAAQAAVLRAFTASGGCAEDGHGSAKTWLRWQARITRGAAGAAMGWMRRLAAHRAVQDALAAGGISASWARQVCDWTDLLPEDSRPAADQILLAAAAAGAGLCDLASLAEQMRRRTAGPDADGRGGGFEDRWVRLDATFGGAGSLGGELTAQCAAALAAVLESLGRRRGPEDLRTRGQREHDALEEACRRLIGSACLPDRAGQPTQIQLHMTLDQLRGLDGAAGAEAAWTGAAGPGAGAAAGPPGAGPTAGPGADCDAAIVPVVSGHVDHDLLARLAAELLANQARNHAAGQAPAAGPATADGQDLAGQAETGRDQAPGHDTGTGTGTAAARQQRAERAARQIILRHAADLLSGPAGLAAWLRTRLPDRPAASVSLPLDIGAATDTIPAHLRRAAAARDRGCRFPGCDQPPAACQAHHLVHRADGGPTSLANLLSLCSFHHLIAVHRWGWGIALHPDGTVTATSPDGSRVLHSHAPPGHPPHLPHSHGPPATAA